MTRGGQDGTSITNNNPPENVPDAILTLTKNVLGQNVTNRIEPMIKRIGVVETRDDPALLQQQQPLNEVSIAVTSTPLQQQQQQQQTSVDAKKKKKKQKTKRKDQPVKIQVHQQQQQPQQQQLVAERVESISENRKISIFDNILPAATLTINYVTNEIGPASILGKFIDAGSF